MKPAPLETFLTGVADQKQGGPDAPAAKDAPTPHAGRVVVLTILGQAKRPMEIGHLKDRSELRAADFEQILSGLVSEGLLVHSGPGFALTEKGQAVADEERSRLLSF